MRVRAAQISAFEAGAEPAFRKRIAAYLRERHGQAVVRIPGAERTVNQISDATMAVLVDTCLARARSHGLSWESTLNAFVTLMVTVAPNFDEQPAVRAALSDDNRPPDFRMQELGQRVTKQDWDAAAAAYDPKSWQSRTSGS
jgi:hypothetical protein